MGTEDRGDLKLLAVALLAAVLLLGLLVLFLLPAAAPVAASLNEGLGLRDAAPWGFGVTLALFLVLAVAAGDGLIGELQFMLGSFFSFFLILTVLIAWVY